jgi:hypothetical protein
MKILTIKNNSNEAILVDVLDYNKNNIKTGYIFVDVTKSLKKEIKPTPFNNISMNGMPMGVEKYIINPWTYWSSEEKIESIRLQRDYLLQQTDWVTIRAIDTGTPESQTWKDYRQALRDFPNNVDANLPIDQIVWPQKPS